MYLEEIGYNRSWREVNQRSDHRRAEGDGQTDECFLFDFGVFRRRFGLGWRACTLNRARLSAPQIRKRNDAAHPILCSPGIWPYPQVKARTAGATPNEITSAIESSSMPNSEVAPVRRAMRPSRKSNKTAKPMVIAARSKCSVACESPPGLDLPSERNCAPLPNDPSPNRSRRRYWLSSADSVSRRRLCVTGAGSRCWRSPGLMIVVARAPIAQPNGG